MGTVDFIFIGVGLAMDAFAVAVCKGMSMKKLELKKAIVIAVYFGFFQALMPIVGYTLGSNFQNIVCNIDHWIAFLCLGIIGGKMIKDSISDERREENSYIDVKTMMFLSIATSIDALAVGITFAFFSANIFLATLIFGVVTFGLSFLGVSVGKRFGDKIQNSAEIFGGVILIFIGLKILLEHLLS